MIKITASALERKMQFVAEQRAESYMKYGEGVARAKIAYYAKNAWQKWALLILERHGA